MFRNFHKFG